MSNFVLLQAPPIYGNLNCTAHQLMRSYVDLDRSYWNSYYLFSGIAWCCLVSPGIPWYCSCTLYNLTEPLVGASSGSCNYDLVLPCGLYNHDLALPLSLKCCKPFLPCLALAWSPIPSEGEQGNPWPINVNTVIFMIKFELNRKLYRWLSDKILAEIRSTNQIQDFRANSLSFSYESCVHSYFFCL